MRGFSIITSPDFYANVRRTPESISAEVFRMYDTLKKEVKVIYTGQIQRESGVDQFIRNKFFRISEFQHATMWQHLSSLV